MLADKEKPLRILCVFSRALTPYEGISTQQNRVCPCQSTQAVSLAEMESSGVDIVEVDVDSFAKAVNEFNIKYCEEKGWTDVYNKIVG